MKRLLVILSFLFLFVTSISFAQKNNPKEIIYAGSFSVRGSKGIYVFQFDRIRHKLTEVQTVSEGQSPSFLAIHPNGKYLYAVYNKGTIDNGKDGSVASFKIDDVTGRLTKLNEQSSEGRGPVHISIDPKGRFIYISNYGSGTLAVYSVNSDGSIGKAVDVIQDHGTGPHPHQNGPHVHSAIPSPDGKFVYVCDLGTDKVFIYKVGVTGKLAPAKMPYFKCKPGSGPRQFAISPNGKNAFLVQEFTSHLVSFKRNKTTGAITPSQYFRMLPEGFEVSNSDATVFVSPNGSLVCATNWGPKGLAIYKLNGSTGKIQLIDKTDTHGLHPRDISIDKKRKYIFVANMGSDNLTIFKHDKATGTLKYTGIEMQVPAISCIQQLFLP